MSDKINCYNPGDDLGELKCRPRKCNNKSYDTSCMYNTQGQFICDTQTTTINPELGVDFIWPPHQDDKKITLSKSIS